MLFTFNSREYNLVRWQDSWDSLVILTPIYYKHYIQVLRCSLAVISYPARDDERHEMVNNNNSFFGIHLCPMWGKSLCKTFLCRTEGGTYASTISPVAWTHSWAGHRPPSSPAIPVSSFSHHNLPINGILYVFATWDEVFAIMFVVEQAPDHQSEGVW